MKATVTGVAETCNENGSYSIIVAKDGASFEVEIPQPHLQQMIEAFQRDAIQRADQLAKNIRVPELTIKRVDIAHKGPSCELMVSTIQIGTVVLLAGNDLLRHMKNEIDRVLSHRGGSTARN